MTDGSSWPPTHEQEHPGATVFLEAGTRFSDDDMLTYAEQSEKPFYEVAHKIDLILTGPHASAAFPREIEPFLARDLSQRLQYDFSDITTDPLARAWARADPRVVYIANPVSRLIFDQNRPKPTDVTGMLRNFFYRLHQKQAGADIGFSGVDTVRAVTFGNVPLLREPADDSAYKALAAVLSSVAGRTSLAYADARDRVIEQVLEAKTRHLHEIDLATVSHRDLQSATMLHVQSVHDTMNATATPDGA
ncbi:MAG: N-formylglutamate amidohydrolase, partial [Paracoccaceae bacterium]